MSPAVVIFRMLSFPALGVALGWFLLSDALLPTIGVGSVERIVALGRHLQSPFPHRPTLALLGNSITREGVDAPLVEQSAPPGWQVENLAISGSGITEFLILAPKLLAAKPAAVAVGILPEQLGRLVDVHVDKAFAYARGGFVAAWPPSWNRSTFPGLEDKSYLALRSTPWEQDLHFRRAPLNELAESLRKRMRGALRQTPVDNWRDPYEMLVSVQPDTLDLHLQQVEQTLASRMRDGTAAGSAEIETLVGAIAQADALPILVILPQHPRLRPSLKPYLAELKILLERLAAERDILVLDAADLLSTDDFADAVHFNAQGREKFSQFLGQRLPSTAQLPPSP